MKLPGSYYSTPHFCVPKNAFVKPPTWPRPRGSGAQVQRGKEEAPLGPPGLDAAFVLQDLEKMWIKDKGKN